MRGVEIGNGRVAGRIPLTMDRAATSIVRSRLFVEHACEEARTALEILSRLDPRDPAEHRDRHAMIRTLLRYLDRLSATHPPRWPEAMTEEDSEAVAWEETAG